MAKSLYKNGICYLFFLFVAICLHAYFVYYKVHFNETCCDSLKQMCHFYPLLNQEYNHGNFFWSWRYGLGGDIFAEFLYYYSASPFFWLTLVFDISTIADIFHLRLWISVFKVFVMMIFMYHLLLYLKRSTTSAFLGSLIYAGSLYFVYYSLKFDFMVDGMIWLPLLILGFERYIDHNQRGLFILSVFLITCSNFYFAYISTLFLMMYAIMKYFLSSRTLGFKDFGKYTLSIALQFILGTLLASFALIPAINSFLQVDRFYYQVSIPFFFDWSFYKSFIYNLFFVRDKSDFLVVLPVMVFNLYGLGFFLRKREPRIRFIFSLVILFLTLIPFTYSLFNGFSFIQYRWLYLLIFTLSLTISYILDNLLVENKKRNITLSLIFLLSLIGIASFSTTKLGRVEWFVFLLAAITYVLLGFRHKLPRVLFSILLVLIVVVNITGNHIKLFSKYPGNPHKVRETQQNILSTYNTPEQVRFFENLKKRDSSFYRVVWDYPDKQFNQPMIFPYYGLSAYNSLLSGLIHRFTKNDYNTLQYNTPSLFKNMDYRLYLETTLGTKYYIIPKKSNHVPYGYKLLMEDNDFKLYENQHTLPVGFMYHFIVNQETFNQLNVGQRDQLLLNAAVVDKNNLNLPTFPVEKLDVVEKKIQKHSLYLKNASIHGKILTASKHNLIKIPNPFRYKWGEILVEIKIKQQEGKQYKLTVNGKTFTYFGNQNPYNYPKKDIVINLENTKKPHILLDLTPGQYVVDEIKLIFNSYKPFVNLVKEKQRETFTNTRINNNHVSGIIHTDKNGILFTSIPYSKGWHIKVDAKPTEAILVNSAFTGIPISAGTHHIEMYYITPYFRLGVSITLMTLILLLASFIYSRRRRKC